MANEKSKGQLSTANEERIEKLWTPPSPVTLVEFHTGVARSARVLLRTAMQQGLGLKPMDAIHLATAQAYGAVELNTYDPKLEKYSAIIGVKICAPIIEQTLLKLEKPSRAS